MQRLFILALALAVTLARPAEAVTVVAHPDVVDEALTRNFVERIYLGKLTRWSDDSVIVPVMLKSGDTHETFVEEMLDRTVGKFVRHWKQAVFTGKGIPPRAFADEEELLEYVAATPGCIGYVSLEADLDGVRVIAVD